MDLKKQLPARAEAAILGRGDKALRSYVIAELLVTTGFNKKTINEMLEALIETGRLQADKDFLIIPRKTTRNEA